MLLTRRSAIAACFATLTVRGVTPGDYRNVELAHPKTKFELRSWSTRAAWERYRRHLRMQILGAAGLVPMLPHREPVRTELIRRTRHDEWSTEALLFETLPGLHIGATVYYPTDTTRRRPAVLIPHGHWKHGRVENIPSYSVPALGANLARQGYVALAWDMVGYNDARYLPHDFGGNWREQLWSFNPLGLQLWNSIRALDYLQSRPDVDDDRIACTGASGGATQTILLCAVDNRVACAVPVNMVSASYQGADPCEEAPNLRLGSNNVEIASMTAPRPMLLVSCTGDWTKNTPTVEFPAIRSVYGLYNKSNAVQNAHFDAEHNYDRRTREAVYKFLAHQLRNDSAQGYREEELNDIRAEDLLSSGGDAEPVSPSPSLASVFKTWQNVTARQMATANAADMHRSLRAALATDRTSIAGASEFGDRLLLNRVGKADRIPATWQEGRGTPALLVHPEGSEAAMATPEFHRLSGARRPVLLVDVFQTGVASSNRERGGRWYLSYNQTDDANRIQDIVTAIRWLRSHISGEPEVIGIGKAALWVLFAAAAANRQVTVVGDLSSFKETDETFKDNCFVPGIRRAGGMETALRLVRNHRSTL